MTWAQLTIELLQLLTNMCHVVFTQVRLQYFQGLGDVALGRFEVLLGEIAAHHCEMVLLRHFHRVMHRKIADPCSQWLWR